jgi:hypothetical protein
MVRSSALCRTLSAHHLAELNHHSYRKRYPAGQLIAGTAPDQDWFAIVVSGAIKLTKSLPDGRQQIVALLFPSDFLCRPFGPARWQPQKRRRSWSSVASAVNTSKASCRIKPG